MLRSWLCEAVSSSSASTATASRVALESRSLSIPAQWEGLVELGEGSARGLRGPPQGLRVIAHREQPVLVAHLRGDVDRIIAEREAHRGIGPAQRVRRHPLADRLHVALVESDIGSADSPSLAAPRRCGRSGGGRSDSGTPGRGGTRATPMLSQRGPDRPRQERRPGCSG